MQLPHVTTRTADIYLDDKDILHIRLLDDVTIDELDAMDNILVMRHMSNQRAMLRLIDLRSNAVITKKATIYLRKEIRAPIIKARAVMVNSPLRKLLNNLRLALRPMPMPQRYFTSYEQAVKWLLSNA